MVLHCVLNLLVNYSNKEIGVMLVSKVGSMLFKDVSVYGPFVFVGICDVFFIMFILLLKMTNKFNR